MRWIFILALLIPCQAYSDYDEDDYPSPPDLRDETVIRCKDTVIDTGTRVNGRRVLRLVRENCVRVYLIPRPSPRR